eukprot:jgi/Chrzof1/13162/Cz07g22100.t1
MQVVAPASVTCLTSSRHFADITKDDPQIGDKDTTQPEMPVVRQDDSKKDPSKANFNPGASPLSSSVEADNVTATETDQTISGGANPLHEVAKDSEPDMQKKKGTGRIG